MFNVYREDDKGNAVWLHKSGRIYRDVVDAENAAHDYAAQHPEWNVMYR